MDTFLQTHLEHCQLRVDGALPIDVWEANDKVSGPYISWEKFRDAYMKRMKVVPLCVEEVQAAFHKWGIKYAPQKIETRWERFWCRGEILRRRKETTWVYGIRDESTMLPGEEEYLQQQKNHRMFARNVSQHMPLHVTGIIESFL